MKRMSAAVYIFLQRFKVVVCSMTGVCYFILGKIDGLILTKLDTKIADEIKRNMDLSHGETLVGFYLSRIPSLRPILLGTENAILA